MQGEYLYINHQSLAPLIHALEDVVEYQSQEISRKRRRSPDFRPKVSLQETHLSRIRHYPQHSL